MASRYRWNSEQGRHAVALAVKKCIPQWSNGLYPWQLEFIIRILDGKDAICCTATGDGKSALFAVPIIVLREVCANRHLYPDLPTRTTPVGIVITPTKGLASNIVLELEKLTVPALAYCSETVSEARKAGVNLTGQIMECKWNVICVDPEHLREKAWRQIPAADKFRANLVYGCVDEAHLMREWGAVFRPLFKHIGRFFRGSCPSTMAVIALSATIQPGAAFDGVCETLGFTEGDLYVMRRSNERPNTQFIMQPLAHGIGGSEFPSLLEFIQSGRKGVVHCRTIDLVFRVYVYLWKCQAPGPHRLRRVKMYHSLRTAEDNQQILADLENDPHCQLVIATVAFSNGLNVKSLLDSISMGVPETVDKLCQDQGRVGRDPTTFARGIVLYQPSTLLAAEKQLGLPPSVKSKPRKKTAAAAEPVDPPSAKGKPKKKPVPMEPARAAVLTEKICYIAAFNRTYQNPPLEITILDCNAAGRPYPCSLCIARKPKALTLLPSPLPPGVILPPFRDEVTLALNTFGAELYSSERTRMRNSHRPRSSYFPTSIVDSIVTRLLLVDSMDSLATLIAPWAFSGAYLVSLYRIVADLAENILNRRKAAKPGKKSTKKGTGKKQRSKKRAYQSSESEDDYSAEEELEETPVNDDEILLPPPSSPHPRPTKRRRPLDTVTNTERPSATTKAPREKLQTAAVVAAGYRPQYNTRRRGEQ
ncbi:P-loop containing nucleoside triphosphate hydrolase protein [Mycena olivaceomarginata]|nr:P-loop containing nucleoside triphosphate hydrolase protein [Mycena olivaceomarginata]